MNAYSVIFKLKPRHKWFSASCPEGHDCIWDGPFKTIGEAAMHQFLEGAEAAWVCQGKFCNAGLRDDLMLPEGCEYSVESNLAFKVIPPDQRTVEIFGRWKCSCGAFMRSGDSDWRWNGFALEHHHGGQLEHFRAERVKE